MGRSMGVGGAFLFTLVLGSVLGSGAGCGWAARAQALNAQDILECGSQDIKPATAERRIAACSRVMAQHRGNKAVVSIALAARALARGQLYDMSGVLTDCAESIRLNPGAAPCYLLRGAAYADRRQHALALADLDKAAKLDPSMAEIDAMRGLVRLSTGDVDRAAADAARAIGAKPSLALGYLVRGGVFYERGDRVRALADANQAIRVQPDWDGGYAFRAGLQYKAGLMAKAREDADQALRLDSRSRGALEVRGCVSVQEGDGEAGLADLTQAIDLNSNTHEAFFCRATALERAGMQAEAMADYRRILDIEAYVRDAREIQAKARAKLAAPVQPQTEAKAPLVETSPQSPPPAAATPSRRIALVIGMGAYAQVPPLANPVRDAQSMAQALRRLGFSEVIERRDLTRAQMEEALKDFGDRAADADWAVIYFAGHGVEVGGVNYLVPVDARLAKAEHVEDETLGLPRVLSKAEPARKLRLVILDACRNNPFRLVADSGRTRAIGRGLGRVEPSGGVLVAYAARDGTTADDGSGGHSPFTRTLLENIEKPGLEISLLFRKVRNGVLAATGNRQEPFTYGSLPDEEFYFRERER